MRKSKKVIEREAYEARMQAVVDEVVCTDISFNEGTGYYTMAVVFRDSVSSLGLRYDKNMGVIMCCSTNDILAYPAFEAVVMGGTGLVCVDCMLLRRQLLCRLESEMRSKVPQTVADNS